MTELQELLQCKNINASVDDKQILHGVELSVNKGEVHVLMGPNGAGKSTFGHVVMGNPLFSIDEGSIFFNGEEITDLTCDKRSQKGIFLSFQAPVEIPGVPLRTFMRTVLESHGVKLKNREYKEKLKEICKVLSLDESYLDRELGVGFSGGEKKKIEMLQLLLLEPELAILDEADSGLDVDALAIVSHGMNVYRQRCNGTLLVITHNTKILDRLSIDKVHVMVQGRIVADGDASIIAHINENGFEQYEKSVI